MSYVPDRRRLELEKRRLESLLEHVKTAYQHVERALDPELFREDLRVSLEDHVREAAFELEISGTLGGMIRRRLTEE